MFKSSTRRRIQSGHVSRIATLSAAALAAGNALILPARAQSGTWISTTGTSWGDINAWSGTQVADGADNLADFAQVDLPAGLLTVDLAGDRTIGQLIFGDTDAVGTAGTWAINAPLLTATNTLTLSHSTAPQVTTHVNTTINSFFSSGGFTKSGQGLLQFNQNNSGMSGTITVEAGTLAVGQTIGGSSGTGGSIGSAAVLLKNGAAFAMNSGSGKIFPGNAINLDTGANASFSSQSLTNGFGGAVTGDSTSTLSISGTTGVNFSANVAQFSGMNGTAHVLGGANLQFRTTTTGATVGGASTTFVVDGQIDTRNPLAAVELGALAGSGTLNGPGSVDGTVTYRVGAKGISSTFAGVIKDNTAARRAGLTKIGGGATLTLTGNSTHTGPTNVNEGTLIINGTKTGAGVTNVANGAVLAGTGNWSGLTTINNGARIAPGNSVGALTLGGLTLAAGSQLDFEFGSGNDQIIVSNAGSLTLNGGVFNLYQEGTTNVFSANDTYQLIGYNTSFGGSLANLSVAPGSQVSGKQYNFGTSGGFITLSISDIVNDIFWNQNTGGDWGTAGNWTAGGPPNAAGKIASFGGGGTEIIADSTINLNGSKTVGTVNFNNPTFAYNIAPGSGGSLIFDNSGATAAITVHDGSHTISAPIQTSNVPELTINTVAADDTLTISDAISGTTALTKAGAGRLILGGANSYAGNTTVSDGTMQLVNGNDRLPAASALTVGATANLDLNGNNQTVSSLAGAGSITNNGAANSTLTINGNSTFDGPMTNGATNSTTIVINPGASLNTSNLGTTANFVVNGGTLNGTNNSSFTNAGIGTGSVTLKGGATVGFTMPANNTVVYLAPTDIPANEVGTINTTNRFRFNTAVTGSGTLNLNANTTVTRLDLQNDWSSFSGTLNLAGTGSVRLAVAQLAANEPLFAPAGWANTHLNMGGSALILTQTSSLGNTVTIGALSGSSATAGLGGSANGAGSPNYLIGGLNQNTNFAGIVSGNASINKTGTGTLSLTGANTFTGTTTVSNGALALGPAAHAPVLTGQGAILNGGKIVMDYTGGSSPKGALVDDALDGIKSNALNPQAGRLRTALAVDNAKAIGWLDDGTSTFQARFTHKGDINLDGEVDSLDLNAFASGYGMTSGAEWANGDFDYFGAGAGKVNTEDFNYLAGNFGAAPVAGALPEAAVTLGAVVPEPSMIGLLGLGGLAMLARRRRGN